MRLLTALLWLAAWCYAQRICPRFVPSQIDLVLPRQLAPGPYPYVTDKASFWVFCDTAPLGTGTNIGITTQGPVSVSGSQIARRDDDETDLWPYSVSTIMTSISTLVGGQTAAIEVSTSAGRATLPVPITFTAQPFIHVADTELVFSFPSRMDDQKLTFWMKNAEAPIAFTVSAENASWLSLTPTSGLGYAEINVRANVNNMAPGNYMGFVVITAPGAMNSPERVPVRFFVPAPHIWATPTNLWFSQATGGKAPEPQNVFISVEPMPSEPITVLTDVPWVTVTPNKGTAPTLLSVGVNGANLAVGTYAGRVRVVGDDVGAIEIVVSLTITTP